MNAEKCHQLLMHRAVIGCGFVFHHNDDANAATAQMEKTVEDRDEDKNQGPPSAQTHAVLYVAYDSQ